MILDAFDDLNWLAVLVATIAWFAFSAIWYSIPPLSKAWQRHARVEPDGAAMVPIMVLTLVSYFVTAVVIGLLVKAIGAEELVDGIALGVTLGVGFGMLGALVTQLYEAKGPLYSVINGVNAVVSFSIVAVILTLWS